MANRVARHIVADQTVQADLVAQVMQSLGQVETYTRYRAVNPAEGIVHGGVMEWKSRDSQGGLDVKQTTDEELGHSQSLDACEAVQ